MLKGLCRVKYLIRLHILFKGKLLFPTSIKILRQFQVILVLFVFRQGSVIWLRFQPTKSSAIFTVSLIELLNIFKSL